MARKYLEQLPELRFDVGWQDTPTGGGIPLFDASVGQLTVSIQDAIVTSYRSDNGDVGDELTIPLYNVAEWIATNWWALLFEPRKSDVDSDEEIGFRSRHWLGFVRDGFALPDLWFHPLGDEIEVSAQAGYLRFARLEFLASAAASVPTDLVRKKLEYFVDSVLQKMRENGVGDTLAHEAWNLVRSTKPEAEPYCRLIGALGLSPYEEHEDVDRVIESLTETPPSVVSDLFQASDDSNVRVLSKAVRQLWGQLLTFQEIDIEPLVGLDPPGRFGSAPWQWGKEAARIVRTGLGISSRDPKGGHAFFDKVGIDPDASDASGVIDDELATTRLSGGMKRQDDTMQIALAEPDLPRRRFAAARGAFLGWSSGMSSSSHLITTARTRDQQASRAFAAELLAPSDYIRGRAGGSAISTYRVEEIARELDVTPAVVRWQAQNNRLSVVGAFW